MVQSIDRPDVGGVKPKMEPMAERVTASIVGPMQWMHVEVDDNIMSSITIRATVEAKADWPMNIMHNARYVIVSIVPMDGKRYYDPADPHVTVKLTSKGSKVKAKLRQYTGPIEKVIEKIKDYLAKVKAEV
jgi:hypothetical protein